MADTDHYFSGDPGSVPVVREVQVRTHGRTVELTTTSGTFSPTRVDPGTQLLVESFPRAPDRPSGSILDLGCGYGPLAISAALDAAPGSVWAVDVNPRARADCRQNAERLGLHVHVADPAEVPESLRFACIVSNPPVRIGKAALRELLGHWLGRLEAGGAAWLVMSRHLGADSLAAWLAGADWEVERIRSRRGYRVLRVRRTS